MCWGRFSNKIASLIDDEEILNANVINAQVSCDNLRSRYHTFAGPSERRLNEALKSIHVIRQAYHGNVFVCNHCIYILKKYVVLTSVIEDQDNTKEKFDEMFGLLSEIMKLVMAPRFLSEEEIDNLKKYCFSFGEKFPVTFPLRKITCKIHELIFNVPRFVMKWKTIGMLSEQEGESKHAAVNAELRSLVCVKDHAERLRLSSHGERGASCKC